MYLLWLIFPYLFMYFCLYIFLFLYIFIYLSLCVFCLLFLFIYLLLFVLSINLFLFIYLSFSYVWNLFIVSSNLLFSSPLSTSFFEYPQISTFPRNRNAMCLCRPNSSASKKLPHEHGAPAVGKYEVVGIKRVSVC